MNKVPLDFNSLFYGTPIFFLHISSIWVKIRLHTENQLPRLSGSGLKVCGGVVVGWWGGVGYTPIAVSHQLRFWLKLGCDKYIIYK